jgi:hypothetical protein
MIVDHGNWVMYTPATPKAEHVGHHVMYARRDSPEADDWYEYVARRPFGDTSVVMTVQHTAEGDVVQAATFDPSEIFPAGMGVIEETEYTGNDPQTDFGQHSYSADARRIGGRFVPPERKPDAIETRILQALDAIVERIEKLEAKVPFGG